MTEIDDPPPDPRGFGSSPKQLQCLAGLTSSGVGHIRLLWTCWAMLVIGSALHPLRRDGEFTGAAPRS